MVEKVKISFTLLLMWLLALPAVSQNIFKEVTHIPVSEAGKFFDLPWAGGLNNPQFSEADLNNDGLNDLVVFDKFDNKVITFINKGTPGVIKYEYAPQYISAFPKGFGFLLMADMNCDGIQDVITTHAQNTEVYNGKYDAQGTLKFDYSDYMKFEGFSGITNIFNSPVNLPAIYDINNDGDLDVLTFDLMTNSFIEYYENQSIELTGTCGDTMIFALLDDCWGNIYESGLDRTAEIKDTCGIIVPKNGSQGSSARHAGASLTAFDEQANGLADILMGSISFESINRLRNGGSPDTSKIIGQDTLFPSYDVPVNVPYYPATFLVDVDNDGKKDLIASPNMAGISHNFNQVKLYKNIHPGNEFLFNFTNDTFFISDMLDFGEGAYPAFLDVDGDGFMDIIVGNHGYYFGTGTYHTALAYLRNTGSNASPEYTLVNRDFANLSNLNIDMIYPTVGDLDGDGDLDMIIGDRDGYLHYFENTAGAGQPVQFVIMEARISNIDVGQFSTPQLVDVTGNGVLDLLVGSRDGRIHFFENKGTATQYDFSSISDNAFFGGADVREVGQFDGFSAPFLTRLDSTNKRFLLSGSKAGTIFIYEVNENNLFSGNFPLISTSYLGMSRGTRTAVTVADVTGDGKKELLLGNYRGGLHFYTQSDSIFTKVDGGTALKAYTFNVYPNPATGFIYVDFDEVFSGIPGEIQLSMFDILGREVLRKDILGEQKQVKLNVEGFTSGVYILRVQKGNVSKSERVMLY